MRNQLGLTLIELLLAVAILAVITVGCYTVTQQFVTADEQLQGRLQALQGLQRSIQIIGRDLSQAFPRSVQSFQDQKPAMLGSKAVIEFTRGGYLVPEFVNRPSSELARVRYYLNNDDQLMRAVWRLVDRPDEEPDGEAVVMSDIEALEWSFIPPANRTAGGVSSENLDQWPPYSYSGAVDGRSSDDSRQPLLPWGVSLTVETSAWGELSWHWEMPDYNGPMSSGESDGSDGDTYDLDLDLDDDDASGGDDMQTSGGIE